MKNEQSEIVGHLIEKQKRREAVIHEILKKLGDENIAYVSNLETSGRVKVLLVNNKTINIRVAFADGGKSEHKRGYERFKISPAINDYSFAIFAIEYLDDLLIYVFRSSEIANLKSLNLRFKVDSKYNIERKSKYDKALRNWGILK